MIESMNNKSRRWINRRELKKCQVPVPKPRRTVALPRLPTHESMAESSRAVEDNSLLDPPDADDSDSSSDVQQDKRLGSYSSSRKPDRRRVEDVRRSRRKTAGRHANLHHLPRAACVKSSIAEDLLSQVVTSCLNVLNA